MDGRPTAARPRNEEEAARRTRLGAYLVVAAVAVVILGELYGYVRAVFGVAMFTAIALVGTRFVRQMVIAPPEPEATDVSGYGLKYICEICGLELRVERAAKESAPRHCTEPMTLVTEGGKPPLRPV
ncbi:MAG: hypothetical protein M3285_04030 [Actinomycetota bacterium]|nr:hypothetical protein [Actinomycetota bacterium]